jgi:hypothetical protein
MQNYIFLNAGIVQLMLPNLHHFSEIKHAIFKILLQQNT